MLAAADLRPPMVARVSHVAAFPTVQDGRKCLSSHPSPMFTHNTDGESKQLSR